MSRYNFFNVLLVSEISFPQQPQVKFNFHSIGMSFLNRGAVTVEYSFDGINVHGDLNPGDSSAGLTFDNRTENVVWFRVASSSANVRVEAWGHSGR